MSAPLPQGYSEPPCDYNGPLYTLDQLRAYGRACTHMANTRANITIRKTRDERDAFKQALTSIRQRARNALNPNTAHLDPDT